MKREALQYMPGLIAVCLGLMGNSSAMLAQSAPGVTDKEILIGSCSALEGLSHFLGTETINGAKAYFDMINDAGGVDGRKLKLVAYDDSDETREQIEGMWGNAGLQENWGNLSGGRVWNGSPRRSKGGAESSRCRAGCRSLLPAADRAGRRSD